jgi:hypothetical protein
MPGTGEGLHSTAATDNLILKATSPKSEPKGTDVRLGPLVNLSAKIISRTRNIGGLPSAPASCAGQTAHPAQAIGDPSTTFHQTHLSHQYHQMVVYWLCEAHQYKPPGRPGKSSGRLHPGSGSAPRSNDRYAGRPARISRCARISKGAPTIENIQAHCQKSILRRFGLRRKLPYLPCPHNLILRRGKLR